MTQATAVQLKDPLFPMTAQTPPAQSNQTPPATSNVLQFPTLTLTGDIGVYLERTQGFKTLHHGIFFKLLLAASARAGHLPKDAVELEAISGLGVNLWKKNAHRFMPFLEDCGDTYRLKMPTGA